MHDLPQLIGNIDIIFEATGNSSVALNAMSILGTNGILCLTGVTGGNKRLDSLFKNSKTAPFSIHRYH